MTSFLRTDYNYNPDVLSCLANLSNDEVFTPPEIVNQMLNLLPEELFQDPKTTFLDPACKSGVFLREIAKRLIKGLEDVIPDRRKRLDHIFQKQLYGIAITELTSLLSRRSVYCSKYANSRYSVSLFDRVEGNIRFKRLSHVWRNGKCVACGASRTAHDREDELETHAYEFIHVNEPKELLSVKFDVIIGNPPYQLDTGGAGRQAKPIYHLFVEQAKKLKPRYLSMIIPSRWFAGGMGLDEFRESMMKDRHILEVVDYTNAKECFPQNSISGGVCYFLWSRDENGSCKFTNIRNGEKNSLERPLDEFPILVRYNEAVDVLHKVGAKKEDSLVEQVSSLTPYGLPTNCRGAETRQAKNDLVLHSSEGISYIKPAEVTKGRNSIGKYKVMISKTSAEHAGEPGSDGRFKVLTSSIKVIGPNEVCTHSYFTVGEFDDEDTAGNILAYLKSRFVRFLLLLAMSSINLSKNVFVFVPVQDFTKPWTDKKLYKKYGLSNDEIAFIESVIKPMESDEGDNGK